MATKGNCYKDTTLLIYIFIKRQEKQKRHNSDRSSVTFLDQFRFSI